MIEDAVDWLFGELDAEAITVTYARSDLQLQIAIVKAITAGGYQDWIADPQLLGALVTPEVGDTVTEQDGTVYHVTPYAGGPCFEYMDPFKRRIRLHTLAPVVAAEVTR